jgi:hypothetical protein
LKIHLKINTLGLDYYLGFSACSSLEPVLLSTCKDGERIDQEWFQERVIGGHYQMIRIQGIEQLTTKMLN